MFIHHLSLKFFLIFTFDLDPDFLLNFRQPKSKYKGYVWNEQIEAEIVPVFDACSSECMVPLDLSQNTTSC